MESSTLGTVNLSPELTAKLEQLQPGTYGFHRSWGIGKIRDWDKDLGRLRIDFPDKANHGMDFEYAAQSLKPLAPGHIEVRVRENLDEVKAQAESDVVGLIQNFAESLEGEATPDRLEQLLVPAVFEKARWKKWWESARRALKKDARFEVPPRRSVAFIFHETPQDPMVKALEAFQSAKGAKAQMEALLQLEKIWKGTPEQAQALIQTVNQTLSAMPSSQARHAFELALVRDDFALKAGLEETKGNLSLTQFLPADTERLARLLNELPSLTQVKSLERARIIFGERCAEMFLSLLPYVSGRVVEVIVNFFKENDRLAEMTSTLERLIRERKLQADMLLWICKSREPEIQKLKGTGMFAAILSALEYDQLADYTRGTKLKDLILNDKDVVRDLLASASHDEVRDVTRAILLTTVFEELDKRSLLATLVKLYPFVQGMIVSGQESQQREEKTETSPALIVSWKSMETRRAELEEISNKKIPENTKDIAIARSYGDMRENHEFKAAKEMQTVLLRRQAELEQMLSTAQGTDFKNANTSEVSVGTRVRLRDTRTQETLEYTILGAWDSNPEEGVISYLTGLAKSLLNRKVGEEIELPLDDGGVRQVKLESIEPYNP